MNEPEVLTFQADTMQQALAKARKTVGADAVIHEARRIKRKGVIGEERNVGVEIVVSKSMAATSGRPRRSATHPPSAGRLVVEDDPPAPFVAPAEEEEGASIGDPWKLQGIKRRHAASSAPKEPAAADDLQAEVRKLSSMVRNLYRDQPENSRSGWDDLHRHLARLEFPQSEIERLIGSASEQFDRPRPVDDVELGKFLTQQLAERIQTAPIQGPSVIALVGPAGGGKTTTAAKLAAQYRMAADQNVALVTIDNFRIAACEQLRIQAEIIGVPFHVANSPRKLHSTLRKLEHMDLVLIDTASKNSITENWTDELNEYLLPNIRTHLVLNVNLRDSSIKSALQDYSSLHFSRLILTKLDETPAKGVIAGIAALSGKPISYVSAGQRVPDDIEAANSRKLARLALGFPGDRQRSAA